MAALVAFCAKQFYLCLSDISLNLQNISNALPSDVSTYCMKVRSTLFLSFKYISFIQRLLIYLFIYLLLNDGKLLRQKRPDFSLPHPFLPSFLPSFSLFFFFFLACSRNLPMSFGCRRRHSRRRLIAQLSVVSQMRFSGIFLGHKKSARKSVYSFRVRHIIIPIIRQT